MMHCQTQIKSLSIYGPKGSRLAEAYGILAYTVYWVLTEFPIYIAHNMLGVLWLLVLETMKKYTTLQCHMFVLQTKLRNPRGFLRILKRRVCIQSRMRIGDPKFASLIERIVLRKWIKIFQHYVKHHSPEWTSCNVFCNAGKSSFFSRNLTTRANSILLTAAAKNEEVEC
jgi:hypothetical protein